MTKALWAATAAFLLAGCNGEVEPQAEANAEEQAGVFEPMTDQIEKARDVEAQAVQHKADIDKALEEADDRD